MQALTSSSNNTTENKPVNNETTWGQWFATGATSAISMASGWQAKAVVGAWVPKIILDASIAKSGYFLGGCFYGPAAIETAKPLITLIAGGAGTLTSLATAAAIVGTGKLAVKGANAISEKMEERHLKNEMRKFQMDPSTRKDNYDIKALDDWDELDTPQEKVAKLKAELAVEKDLDKKNILRGKIYKMENTIAIERFHKVIA